MQTKSGTNELHGSAFEFLQRDKFQARNPFTRAGRREPAHGPRAARDQEGPVRRLHSAARCSKNKCFFFGDYQGTRSSIGGSKRLTVPTAAGAPGQLQRIRRQHLRPGRRRLRATASSSPATSSRRTASRRRRCHPEPAPAARTHPGIRDNYIAQGSRSVRQRRGQRPARRPPEPEPQHCSRATATQRFDLNGPQAFGAGGGSELVSLGGQSKVRNHSVAAGRRLHPQLDDRPRRPPRLLQVRRGRAAQRLRHDARGRRRHPRPQHSTHFSVGPARSSSSTAAPTRSASAPGLDAGRCNCPLAEHEKQSQVVSNLTKLFGNHTAKFGFDIRRAYNLRVPATPTAPASCTSRPTARRGPDGGGIGHRHLPARRRDAVPPLRQHEHGRPRAAVARVLLRAGHLARHAEADRCNYGLRADIINPQTVNEAGQRRLARHRHRPIRSAASATSTSPATSRTRSTGRRASASPTS